MPQTCSVVGSEYALQGPVQAPGAKVEPGADAEGEKEAY